MEGNGQGPVVEVRDLVKRYRKAKVNAVDGVSFAVRRGEVLGLLGPNGAGKTTTVGSSPPGCGRPAGRPASAGSTSASTRCGPGGCWPSCPSATTSTGRCPSARTCSSTPPTTGCRRAERARRADDLLEEFGLADRADDKPDMFSGGQAQRVMIARALMHAPEVLFLDEPTTGLDPAARLFVWDRVRELQGQGRDGGAHHPRHGRGGRAGRPGRDHGPRQAARPRHPGGADPRRCRAARRSSSTVDGSRRTALVADARRPRRRRARRAGARPGRTATPWRRRCGLRLYLTGEAAPLVAPVGRAGGRGTAAAHRRGHRRPQPGGRLHRASPGGRCDEHRPARPRHRRRRARGPPGRSWPCSGATSTSPAASCRSFLAQVVLQPLFLLFVFGKVLGRPRLHPARLRPGPVPRHRRPDGVSSPRCRAPPSRW